MNDDDCHRSRSVAITGITAMVQTTVAKCRGLVPAGLRVPSYFASAFGTFSVSILYEWLIITPLFIRWRNAFQACPYHICTIHVTAAGRY